MANEEDVKGVRMPPLYKRDSHGNLMEWIVRAEGDWVVTEYGRVDSPGSCQTARVKAEPTNAGRSNARDGAQQAAFEAKAAWDRQRTRKGYVEDRVRAMAGESDQEGPAAMLAHRYDKHSAKIKFPCFGQRKYDGLRCTAVIEDGQVALFSREGKPIGLGLKHLREALARLPGNHTLDGELFSSTVPFEKIVSYVKSGEALAGNEVVEYHVYDCPSVDQPYSVRRTRLWDLLGVLTDRGQPLVYAETVAVQNQAHAERLFLEFKNEGFEGLMLRNADGRYKPGKRSYDLQKVKFTSDAPFEETEYEIVGVKPGRGKMTECAIFQCRTAEGLEFDVKMKGALEDLKKYLLDDTLWRGKLLTVTYQELTDRGVPRFPVGVRVRERGL